MTPFSSALSAAAYTRGDNKKGTQAAYSTREGAHVRDSGGTGIQGTKGIRNHR